MCVGDNVQQAVLVAAYRASEILEEFGEARDFIAFITTQSCLGSDPLNIMMIMRGGEDGAMG